MCYEQDWNNNMCGMPMPMSVNYDMWMDMHKTCEMWGPECILWFGYFLPSNTKPISDFMFIV